MAKDLDALWYEGEEFAAKGFRRSDWLKLLAFHTRETLGEQAKDVTLRADFEFEGISSLG